MIAALTFDDGPARWTGPILDLLNEHDVRATFFVCGWAVEGNHGVLQDMLEDGHEIGNHTFTHPHLTDVSLHEVDTELWRGSDAIFDATGVTPTLWRAPYLQLNAGIETVASRRRLRHVGCDVIPADWAQEDPQRIAQNVLGDLRDGSIVLLHDGLPPDGGSGTKSRQPTVDALRLLLETEGISWVRVSDL